MKIQVRKNGQFKIVYFELPTYGVDPVAVAAKIDAVAESWNGPETVLFRGQGPVWLYGMLVHSAHATPNCATFEPRKDGYVVVHQHGGEYRPGDVIASSVVGMTIEQGEIVGGEDATPRRHIVVSVGGPPHSGKSVLLAELYRQLLDRLPGEVFLQRGCPDGEGMWSSECDPSLAKAIRQKGQFSKEFCGWATDALRGLMRGFKITLVDLGGKRLPPNDDLLRGSTHCIVLSSQEAETSAWVEYGQSCGCDVIAVIDSRLVTNESGELDSSARSSLDLSATPVTGSLVNLDREAPADPYRDAVSALAERLIAETA
ncbi:MAG: hypothetical protein KBD21_02525 [Candidatus Pacebacteria bacterium]|nr:hypothetical protein [Candidatus Paceibacterota bacterium]